MKLWIATILFMFCCQHIYAYSLEHKLHITNTPSSSNYTFPLALQDIDIVNQIDFSSPSAQQLIIESHNFLTRLTIKKTKFLSNAVSQVHSDIHSFRILLDNQQPAFGSLIISNQGIYIFSETTQRKFSLLPTGLEPLPISLFNYPNNHTVLENINDDSFNELPRPSNQEGIRIFRFAMTTTLEFWQQYHPSNRDIAYSHLIAIMHQVNEIIYRDAAIRFIIVTDKFAFANANNDFTDADHQQLIQQNQEWMTQQIGVDNFDIGHIFSKTSGGLSFNATVCSDERKALAVTGFDVDTDIFTAILRVSHEIGHQFGATHTFNADGPFSGYCNNQRQPHHNAFTAKDDPNSHFLAASAYEPGSGSTIMAYAGLCNYHNIQANNDSYFHSRNIEQMRDFVSGRLPFQHTRGGECGTLIAPEGHLLIDAGFDYSIPYQTPFTLKGKVYPVDLSSSLALTWEQFDLGDARTDSLNPFSDIGQGPFLPSQLTINNPVRIITQSSSTSSDNTNHLIYKKLLPEKERTLHFRFSARASGHLFAYDDMTVRIIKTPSPFTIDPLPPLLSKDLPLPITWNVADTNLPPIDCHQVAIDLSYDGGQTFIRLSENTENDGEFFASHNGQPTGNAIIRITCSDNIFFALSNRFEIKAIPLPTLSIAMDTVINDKNSGKTAITYLVNRTPNSDHSLILPYSIYLSSDINQASINVEVTPLQSGKLLFDAGKTSTYLEFVTDNINNIWNRPLTIVINNNNAFLASKAMPMKSNTTRAIREGGDRKILLVILFCYLVRKALSKNLTRYIRRDKT